MPTSATPVSAEIKVQNGAPRLFINGQEVYPLLAWSWGLVQSAPVFKRAGIKILHPILGLDSAWLESNAYDWSQLDGLFAQLLAIHPDAYFLPRILLDVPEWWKQAHPEELIQCAVPLQTEGNQRYHTSRVNPEGGWSWGIQLREPSFASERWRADMTSLLRAFLRHVEGSALSGKIIGYQVGSGIYGEWHYFIAEFLPDLSVPMRKKLDYVPDTAARVNNTYGLLRDPEKECAVIEYYHRFHEEICAETILHFARIVKQETKGRVLCGLFYGYTLENVWVQEGGHLAPEKILASPDIDFLASPYTYQNTNIADRPWWQHDIVDDAGNHLGRARGVAGDGGYRILLESAKRHGKLYFVEMDPSTYLQPDPDQLKSQKIENFEEFLARVGGEGWNSIEGTRRILQRDLGQMLVCGNGGWLFDFGPVMSIQKSWYDDDPIVKELTRFLELGNLRQDLNLESVAQVAAVYDAKSFFITRHWKAEEPFAKGVDCTDYFTQWFLDGQARALHRLGAPVDFLYRFDLAPTDAQSYKCFFMMNLFYLTETEVSFLTEIFKNSQATVVWFYAPGFVTPEKLALSQMERLTGFKFSLLEAPGPMMIQAEIPEPEPMTLEFGVRKPGFPRFAVTDADAQSLGHWIDNHQVAFARKQMDGWQSIYLGTAPAPVEILRWLVKHSGAPLWSSQPDIVRATHDAAMLVATSAGERTLNLPRPMVADDAQKAQALHSLKMDYGDVKIFLPKRQS